VSTIADDIRAYALNPRTGLARDVMMTFEHCMVETFQMPRDWEEASLWSVEWRTFALIVAESLDSQEARYFHALRWALGVNGEFPTRKDGQGAYWWRTELQRRAGLYWDGKRFIDERGIVPRVTP
jgi:hypothetical protein